MTFSKGKVERGGVGYLRQNFWPLRQFTDLSDVNRQVREWLDEVANQRLHRETRQRPCERFRPDCLRPLPALTPDYRDTAEALVIRIFASSSTAIATAPRLISWASISPSKPMLPRWRFITAIRKSFATLAAGGAVKPWVPSASRKNCSPKGCCPPLSSAAALDRSVGQ